jgi:hypothetical protein
MDNLLTRRTKIKRMASSGINDFQIAVFFRVKLNVLKLFFPYELELGVIIASLRFRLKIQWQPQSKKRTYSSDPHRPAPSSSAAPTGKE